MGGNALASQGAERIDRVCYDRLLGEILNKLQFIKGYYGWVETPSYSTKNTFGDVDVLCTNITDEVFKQVLDLFENPPNYRNTGVLSLLYRNLQVDLISVDPEDYHTAKVYYSYNDLGNLMGKIYHKFGLKYGHRGLVMPIRDEENSSHKFDEIVISKNPDKIFEFIGMPYSKFLSGFAELEDIFQFVMGSPYFTPDLFSLENMNNKARVRDKKRATYNAFLEYISHIHKVYPREWEKDKSEYLNRIFNFFPEAYGNYTEALTKFEEHKLLQEKFNGIKVLEWLEIAYPGEVVKGKDFGHFMQWVMEMKVGRTIKDIWIKTNSEDSIRYSIVSWYKEWKYYFNK